MTVSKADDRYLPELNPKNDIRITRLSKTLNCSALLVQETWHGLKLDEFEDSQDLSGLREAASIYLSAAKHSKQLSDLLEGLPESEIERIAVGHDNLVQSSINSIKELTTELETLHAHRKSVVARNPSRGSKDPRADALAELVAVIFESEGRPVTFGHMKGEPSTHFCKAVRDVIKVCENQIKLSMFVTRFVTDHQNSTGKTLGKPLVFYS